MRTDLGPGEQIAAKAVAGLVGVLGVVGFGVSATNVAEAVEPSFGQLAWTVPFGVDVGIAAFTGLDLLMARMDMRSRWLRIVPWALIAVTIYLNVAGEPELMGKVAHAVLPLTWVVAVEAGAHILRTWAGLATKAERMDRVRVSRWFLAPIPTLLLWRRMILWETRSYPDALQRERDRKLALCDLQDGHGRFLWRWKVSRRERALYRLGELAPVSVEPAPDPAPIAAPPPPVELPSSNGNGHRPNGASGTNGDGITLLAEQIAQDMVSKGQRLSRRALQARVKAENHGAGIGTTKADAIVAKYQDQAVVS